MSSTTLTHPQQHKKSSSHPRGPRITQRGHNRGGRRYRQLMGLRPPTSSFRIIFPWSPSKNDYSMREFNQKATCDRVTSFEVKLLLHRLSTMEGYRTTFDTNLSSRRVCLYMLALIGSLLLFFFPVFITIVVIARTEMYRKENKVIKLAERARRLEEMLKEVNLEWRAKGVKWSVGELGAWIQLDLDFLMDGIPLSFGPQPKQRSKSGLPSSGYMVVPVNTTESSEPLSAKIQLLPVGLGSSREPNSLLDQPPSALSQQKQSIGSGIPSKSKKGSKWNK